MSSPETNAAQTYTIWPGTTVLGVVDSGPDSASDYWVDANTAGITITGAGLATAGSADSTTIMATLSGATGKTNLSITAKSLRGGTQNVAYSAMLAGSGGTPPYRGSIASGSLPVGLSLNSGAGVISEMPTAMGTFSFSAQVTDSGYRVQSITQTLSITVIANASFTIWAGTIVPGVVDSGPDSAIEVGVKFLADTAGYIYGHPLL